VVCWLTIIPQQLADPDLWGRLSVAALWFRNGYFPYRDVFSFTAFHHRWIDHEWLSGVLFYLSLLQGGEIGLHLLKYGILLVIFYLLFSHCRRTAPRQRLLPLSLFAGLTVLFNLYGDVFLPTIRAQVFSFLFFYGFLWILERVRQSPTASPANQTRPSAWLWFLLPLGVIWANAHGGFILGLILLMLYGLGELLEKRNIRAAWPYWRTAILLTIAIGIFNPYGFTYWPFIVQALTMPRPLIGEWAPLPLLNLDFWALKLLMLGALGALILTGFRAHRARSHNAASTPSNSGLATATLVLLFLMGLAVKGLRFKAFFTLGVFFYAPVLVAACLSPVKSAENSASSTPAAKTDFNWLGLLPALAGASALCLILTTYPPQLYARTIVQTGDYAKARGLIPFPVGMVKALQDSPYRGNLINPFSWGEFLAWTLYPRFKIAWDGRYEEVYQKPEVDFYTEFYALPHPGNPQRIAEMANHSGGDFILIESISPNQALLAQSPDWQLLTTDGFYFLYGRSSLLLKLPPYHAAPNLPKQATFTIGDFFQPDDLKRFKSP